MLFSSIHDAYETLSDQVKRDQYDLVLAREQTKSHAEEQARQSAAASRENAEDQYAAGMKHLKSGNYWGADEAFQWASKLDPENAEYVFRRAQALSRMPRRGHDAEELFKKSLKMAPRKIEYHLELGNFYERIALKTKAMSTYQNALKLDPNSEKIKQAIAKLGK
jgi:tetratricopeptide (TPR) repeat protein